MALAPPPFALSRPPVPENLGSAEVGTRYDQWQQSVIDSQARNLVVGAFAGTGKTTTAVGYALARPDARILYVCFGKKNQMDAQARFPANVECRTSHSLAYAAVGAKFKNQIAMQWRPRDLAAQVQISDMRTAAAVQAVLGHFFASTEREVGAAHVLAAQAEWGLDKGELEKVLSLASFAWKRMSTPGSGVSMPPDGYMKLWALSKPKLTKYTHIILDEAQDTAPVTAEVLLSQSHATKVLIGDRHQSIYLFRGALNAMESFSASGAAVLSLPQSWRFGPDVADKANRLLSMFKGESTAIIGSGPGRAAERNEKRAVLARTNVGLYEEAAEVMGRQTHWVGGIEAYRVDTLMDAWRLKTGQRNDIRDTHIRSFDSWGRYADEADATRDQSSKMMVKLIDKYGVSVPRLVEEFRRNALPTEVGARLVLTTGHKAKGMDWDRVKLSEDFSGLDKSFDSLLDSPTTHLNPKSAQEINLLYVAVTRARHSLTLNSETQKFLDNYQRKTAELMASVARKQGLSLPRRSEEQSESGRSSCAPVA
jgi:F-box protein 18 (helicase)